MTDSIPRTQCPIHVDFLTSHDIPLPGRLGLACAPGRTDRTGSDGPALALRADIAVLQEAHRVDLLVTLQEQAEMLLVGNRDLFAEARREGLRTIWFPIPDGFPPFSMPAAYMLVRELVDELTQGGTVVVHCYAGLGRSGTIAACVMVALGATAGRAVDRVRTVRPGAIPGEGQVLFVEAFEEVRRAAEARRNVSALAIEST